VVKEKAFHTPAAEPMSGSDGCDVTLQQLKEKFEETIMKSGKVAILTLLPKHWSSKIIEPEFPFASNYMVHKAKQLVEEGGIFEHQILNQEGAWIQMLLRL
jgi:hypothetical protein